MVGPGGQGREAVGCQAACRRRLACVRGGKPAETFSPADLAYHVQTALIMGMWSLKQGKVARFDAANQTILM
ncbi:MAG TPA: hypothetical protein VM431_07375 [Phycisphaerae bacterium]|nr:hypothetical protein [Phycisphaerae bacterium]